MATGTTALGTHYDLVRGGVSRPLTLLLALHIEITTLSEFA